MTDERPSLEVESWAPKAELFGMVHRALTTFAHTWPKAFLILNSKSDASREFVTNYCFALRFVDWRAIQPATREWVSTQKFAPKPAEFAAVARQISAKHFPKHRTEQSGEPTHLFAGAQAYWFECSGRVVGYGRLDELRGIYFKLRNGDLLGISDSEYAEIKKGSRSSGPLRASEVPEMAAPAEYHAALRQGAA